MPQVKYTVLGAIINLTNLEQVWRVLCLGAVGLIKSVNNEITNGQNGYFKENFITFGIQNAWFHSDS